MSASTVILMANEFKELSNYLFKTQRKIAKTDQVWPELLVFDNIKMAFVTESQNKNLT